jgi:hypothetical protein
MVRAEAAAMTVHIVTTVTEITIATKAATNRSIYAVFPLSVWRA